MKITKRLLRAADSPGLDLDWIVANLFPRAACAKYKKDIEQARDKYEKTRFAARAEYEKIVVPALAKYKQAISPAWAEYEKATSSTGNRRSAGARYENATGSAWEEYERVRSSAMAACGRDMKQSKAELKKARIKAFFKAATAAK